jgi:large subunit ribosomal protein L22
MMQSKTSVTKYVRIPPRKARLAADIVRGLGVEEAKLQLLNSSLKAGRLLAKTLKSAVANAENGLNVSRRDLYISEIRVDCGPVLKRAKSKNKGGRVPVMKRTSHFTIVVSAKQEK